MIRMVCFDVGETLVDETRHWGEWADHMGIPHLTFFAVFGMVIAQGRHHRDVFQVLRPGFDHDAERAKRIAQGWRYRFEPTDFYPDALPCLRALQARGIKIGLAGNQPRECEDALRDIGITVDLIGSSEGWGVEKPSPAFFTRLAQEANLPPNEIAYVGDRIDNDVGPAADAGMTAIFLRRGPWAIAQENDPAASKAHLKLDSLSTLSDAIAKL
ncbi:MAG TPA: HAD family hydrolase [Rhizomicrobium sp.]|jgi:HAD superfamily hydrolase (TIGR01549 family)|nr:HAD family hydrolase [Rhizomicrobium sp.]